MLALAFIMFFFVEGAISFSNKFIKWIQRNLKRKIKEYKKYGY